MLCWEGLGKDHEMMSDVVLTGDEDNAMENLNRNEGIVDLASCLFDEESEPELDANLTLWAWSYYVL